jgi:hypothetical protein
VRVLQGLACLIDAVSGCESRVVVQPAVVVARGSKVDQSGEVTGNVR